MAFPALARPCGVCFLLAVFPSVFSVAGSPSPDFVLAEFNGTGFQWTSHEFAEEVGAQSTRLTNSAHGWGVAGFTASDSWDWSDRADSRFIVDFVTQEPNGSDQFILEVVDQNGNKGKWSFLASGDIGETKRMVAQTPLAVPSTGQGDYKNLDLEHITSWRVLGDYDHPLPFDVAFDRIALSGDAPAPAPYEGQAPDAPWREMATSRIETHRKSDLTLHVVDASGAPVPRANVHVQMTRHAFGFGSAVQGSRLGGEDPQDDAYKQKVIELFNLATIENSLKWEPWEGEWGANYGQQHAIPAIDWLRAQGLKTRGHVLVWPGVGHMAQDVEDLLAAAPLSLIEQETLRNRIANHINEILVATAGKIDHWDVVNEPRTSREVADALAEGESAFGDWFDQAATLAPDAKLSINEFGVLVSAGSVDSHRQQLFFDTVESLLDQGAPVEIIGLQSHFQADTLTGPNEVWEILDRFSELGVKVQIKEFDVDMVDESLQADFTRDFLTALFAHPAVTDIVQWGFWEGAHWRPDAALFRSDWSAKPNGQAFLDLVFDQWWTDQTVKTNDLGEATLRAFQGDHLIEVNHAGVSLSATATLDDDSVLELKLPLLLGDYNGDGAVDAADFTVWRHSRGETVAPYTGADGDGSGQIDAGDYVLWRSRFGATPTEGAAQVSLPAPTAQTLLLVVGASLGLKRLRSAPPDPLESRSGDKTRRPTLFD